MSRLMDYAAPLIEAHGREVIEGAALVAQGMVHLRDGAYEYTAEGIKQEFERFKAREGRKLTKQEAFDITEPLAWSAAALAAFTPTEFYELGARLRELHHLDVADMMKALDRALAAIDGWQQVIRDYTGLSYLRGSK